MMTNKRPSPRKAASLNRASKSETKSAEAATDTQRRDFQWGVFDERTAAFANAVSWAADVREVVRLIEEYKEMAAQLKDASAAKRRFVRGLLRQEFAKIRVTLSEVPGGKVPRPLQKVLTLLVGICSGDEPDALEFAIKKAHSEIKKPLETVVASYRDAVEPDLDVEWPESDAGTVAAAIPSPQTTEAAHTDRTGKPKTKSAASHQRKPPNKIDEFERSILVAMGKLGGGSKVKPLSAPTIGANLNPPKKRSEVRASLEHLCELKMIGTIADGRKGGSWLTNLGRKRLPKAKERKKPR